jgi:hypothetical protein
MMSLIDNDNDVLSVIPEAVTISSARKGNSLLYFVLATLRKDSCFNWVELIPAGCLQYLPNHELFSTDPNKDLERGALKKLKSGIVLLRIRRSSSRN